MKIFTIYAGLIIATIVTAGARNADAQSSFDPQAELSSILNTYMLPAGQEAQDALNLAASDPQKACDLSKQAVQSVNAADAQLTALHNKLVQHGYDPSKLQPVQDKVKASVQQFPALEKAICSGEIAQVQTDPATQAMTQKIGGYMNAYFEDVRDLTQAAEANDMATYCARAEDGEKQLQGLGSYLVDLRRTTKFSPDEITALDGLNAKLAGFKTENDARLAKCKAAP